MDGIPEAKAASHIQQDKMDLRRIDIVAIGSSTGGPNALAEVIPRLPANFPVPILIAQHMPSSFTNSLAERLDKESSLTVSEAKEGMSISSGEVLIAPGDHHMVVERCEAGFMIVLNKEPPENSCRPSVDVLFRSVAKCYGPHALAVVLTGMGQDGVAGAREISSAGSNIIVQDKASSVVWGMPGYIAQEGLADQVVGLADVANYLMSRASYWREDKFIVND